ncbi:D-alanyl-D-alanine carboxypeptidase/D-alanyl-D-alanine endopeptidase [Nocardioides insulae]|uniref:D-alanyl-D-alanine carboxypeptidase/D-alanyl-D-alanine endopeptidase n=1 Tax=Nocardioides insulae TaxID=394734 RepID=UPI00041F7513|nr:D-alanyl-D-alanine carboxypeptidase/D-alanyl-D-alanine-endopeptidase [Nocardioides insulae]
MARGDVSHAGGRRAARRAPRRRRTGRWVALAVVLVLGGTAAAAYQLGWVDYAQDTWFAEEAPPPAPEPEGLDLPEVVTPAAVAAPVEATAPGPAKVRRAISGPLGDDDLGPHVVAGVAPVGGGETVWTQGSGAFIPASTTKLLTSTAALDVIDPETRFATRVVAGGDGRIVLVGGGDPLLASDPAAAEEDYADGADIRTLARRTAAALKADGQTRVRLGYDDSLFTGPAVNPAWEADYVPDGVVSPITALWVDEGRPADGIGRVADPSFSAAQAFADGLRKEGITVRGRPAHGTAGATGAELARVQSPPLREIVEHLILISDNEATEVVARQVGLAVSGEGSSAAGVRDVMATLTALGVDLADSRIYDGSGLSRQGRLTASALLTTLQAAGDPAHPALATVVGGLPVAGFTGSLTTRFDEGAADRGLGRVRAKTGTLTGVSSLAGVATGVDGTGMVFVVAADRIDPVDTLGARAALDRAASALGACACGAG